jgi:hypothetical protein
VTTAVYGRLLSASCALVAPTAWTGLVLQKQRRYWPDRRLLMLPAHSLQDYNKDRKVQIIMKLTRLHFILSLVYCIYVAEVKCVESGTVVHN